MPDPSRTSDRAAARSRNPEATTTSAPSPEGVDGGVAEGVVAQPVIPVLVWGRLVAARRRRQGLSQKDLAHAASVSQQTISKVERGVLCAHDSLKLRLAAALECQPESLFPWSETTRDASGQVA